MSALFVSYLHGNFFSLDELQFGRTDYD